MSLLILGTLLAACFVSSALSCSCLYEGPKHLQDIYCEASFVIQVKVDGDEEIGFQRKYILADTVVYKSSPAYNAVVDKSSLYTGLYGASCGVHLDIGTTYIISGYVRNVKLEVNLCGSYYEPVEDLTTAQLCYLRSDSGYAKGCKNCKIQHCGYESSCDQIKPSWNTCVLNQKGLEFKPRDENAVCTPVTRKFLWFYFQFCQWSNLSGPLDSSVCQRRGR